MRPAPPAFGRIGARSGKKYWLLVVAVAIPLFYAQCLWMKDAKRRAPDSPLAEPLSQFMMKVKGIPVEESAPGAAAGGAAVAGRPAAIREEVQQCDYCEGRGRDETGGPCPVCFGHGGRWLRRSPVDELCPACAGMGRVTDGEGKGVEECPRCGGRGLVVPASKAAEREEQQ